ncbi:MAG: OmpA family protein [Pseudomonadota bacterium]
MYKRFTRAMLGAALASALALPVAAQNSDVTTNGDGTVTGKINGVARTVLGERYVPTIWVDPDGCEHWVMDDGFEGYMTPHVTRQGIPVCRRGRTCGELNSDQFFATDSYRLNAGARKALEEFFNKAGATSYIISGHTDSRASDAYNLRLSLNRANAVAKVAQKVGARIADVRGYGERLPKKANSTAAGRKANRRVEILCLR